MDCLREEIFRLPTSNVHLFFSGLRNILDRLNVELASSEDEVSFMREELPQKLADLRQCRDELLSVRSEVEKSMKEYTSRRDSFVNTLKENGMDLLVKLAYLSSVEKCLKDLRSLRAWVVSAEELRSAITTSDYEALLCSLQQAASFSFEELDANVREELCARRQELMESASCSVHLALKNTLSDVGYPLEEYIDMRNIEKKMAKLIALLKCIHFLEASSRDGSPHGGEIVHKLFEPFEKRFNFHFYGDLRTNNDTKPEWFFTQVLTWLKVNSEFIESVLRAVFTQLKEARTTQEALERKLVYLAVKKARCLAERVASDSVLFSHLIDEAVAFENELKDAGYTPLMGQVLSVFCETPLLNRWLELERESCTTGVENVLMSDARWKNRYSEVADLDLHRVPECTDQFIVLIESMTERYRWVTNVDVQARFLELQVLMLDEYRLRLVQISQQLSSPWEEPFVQLLNSFWYVGCILEEWNDAEAFMKVQTRGTNVRLRGIFDDMAEMYRHVWRQRATDMAIAFHQFVRVQLTAYAKLNWFSMEGTKPTDITPSFCPFLLEIRLLLGRIAASISPDSALTLYSLLNEKIADALMQLIESTSFNYQGAIQMLFDITSSLIPLLNSLYSRSATSAYEALDDHKFEEAISWLRLLSIPTASAVLLRSEIKKSPEEMTAAILAPYDASIISRRRALMLFEQRCDLQLDSDVTLRLYK
uniref:RAD50-interacting protein 1 n=1 Tax=Ascaris lumbricoides TaxID=6252 RepID=A0A0M3I5D6_ASCLU